MKKLLMIAAMTTATTAFAGEQHDLSKVPTPTERKGISIEVLQQNDLAPQISAFAGYDLRMRKITFAPGATLTTHSHAIRPGMVYILKGEVLEVRGDDRRLFKAGDSWLEDAGTNHWLANISDEPVVFIMIDTPVQK